MSDISKDSKFHLHKSSGINCSLIRLKVQQEFLEKSLANAWTSLRLLDPEITKELDVLKLNAERTRLEYMKQSLCAVKSVFELLNKIKNDITSEDKIRLVGIRTFRGNLLDLEDSIDDLKESCDRELQNMVKEENSIWKCLLEDERKINNWKQITQPAEINQYETSHTSMPEEVNLFQKFLKECGGHSGGWNEEDHALFLKIYTKYSKRKRDVIVEKLEAEFPDIARDKIINHCEWYAEYLNLRNLHRQAIEKWRQTKTKNRNNEKEQLNETPVDSAPKEIRKLTIQEEEEKKRRLQEWKKRKELQKIIEKNRHMEEKKKKLDEWKKHKAIQAQKKAAIEEYRQEKYNRETEALVQKQLDELQKMEERAIKANVLLKAFREQDEQYIERRRQCRQRMEQQKQANFLTFESFNKQKKVVAKRDPQRLLRSTLVWQERVRPVSPTESSLEKPHLHLMNMPHLAVPGWRRGLT